MGTNFSSKSNGVVPGSPADCKAGAHSVAMLTRTGSLFPYYQMSVSLLRKHLEIENPAFHACDRDKFKIPSSFNYATFKNAIAALFQEVKNIYFDSATYLPCKEEYYGVDESLFTEDLLVEPLSSQLSVPRLLDILQDHSLETFLQSLASFCDDVEKRVSVGRDLLHLWTG